MQTQFTEINVSIREVPHSRVLPLQVLQVPLQVVVSRRSSFQVVVDLWHLLKESHTVISCTFTNHTELNVSDDLPWIWFQKCSSRTVWWDTWPCPTEILWRMWPDQLNESKQTEVSLRRLESILICYQSFLTSISQQILLDFISTVLQNISHVLSHFLHHTVKNITRHDGVLKTICFSKTKTLTTTIKDSEPPACWRNPSEVSHIFRNAFDFESFRCKNTISRLHMRRKSWDVVQMWRVTKLLITRFRLQPSS